MPDIFISYSRSNLVFVQQLVQTLSQRGKNPWFDQIKEPLQGIPPGSRWWDEITYGIENADNFLLVISPQSIASPYCHAEIAHARQHDKRIVTLLYCGDMNEKAALEAIDEAIESIPDDTILPTSVTAEETHLRTLVRKNWLALSQIQYVSFSEQQVEAVSIEQLMQALDLDLAWIKMRSQIRQAAQLWADNDYSKDYLWSQNRLKPVWEMMKRASAELSELEQRFLAPEYIHLLRELEDISTGHARREEIGFRLGELGDPRPGVGLRKDGLPDITWCYVAGGFIEAREVNGLEKSEDVPPFYIAKYPITYLQFKAFRDAPDGYWNEIWWEGLHTKNLPWYQNRPINNYPAEMIAWVAAVAFTRWLTEKAKTVFDLLPHGFTQVLLPTEAQWVFAATQGNADQRFPWGYEERPYAMNTKESGLGRTIAVGMYPIGAAACGAEDMLGNTAEWMLNDYEESKEESVNPIEWLINYGKSDEEKNVPGLNRKLLRGATHRSQNVDIGVRSNYEPNSIDSLIAHSYGFRVVCVSTTSVP